MMLFTHTDLDGAMCAVLYKIAFGINAPVRYLGYDTLAEEILDYLHGRLKTPSEDDRPFSIHITDLSPQGPRQEEVIHLIDSSIASRRLKANLFDHHVTSLPLRKKSWVQHNLDACGAKVYYEWLLEERYLGHENKALRELVELTDLRDRWVAGDPSFERAKELNALFQFFGLETFVLECWKTLPDDVMDVHRTIISTVRAQEQRAIRETIEKNPPIRFRDAQGNYVDLIVVSGGVNVSEVCAQLLQDASVDYVAAILPGVDTISLRSRSDGPDVSKIAQAHNGGGHPHAAGFPFGLKRLLIDHMGEIFTCTTDESKTQSSPTNAFGS